MALPFTFTFAFMKTKRGNKSSSKANTRPHPHLYNSTTSSKTSHQYLTIEFRRPFCPQFQVRLGSPPSLPAVHHLSDICCRQEARRRHCHRRLPPKLNRKHCKVINASKSHILTMSTSQDHDYLTSLPTELLIKVIAEVPMDYYLDLTHTSKCLRDFMKANVANICNEAIRFRHSIAAEFLKTELKSGWLVPTHEGFDMEDEDYIRALDHYFRPTKVSRFKYYSLLGALFNGDVSLLRTMIINVKSSGPQFLHFLERNIMIFCDEHRLPQSCTFQLKLRNYWGFLNTFNLLTLEVKNGKLVASGLDENQIPKAMLWYYGLDKLVLTP
ncbi:hypothetical protein NA56DRAFT_709431 [Hyaloscypha hepaticicola]|uniref:F-box domain-containing protein n=1 Tax=Hyaloscypha hepaticicola TaxID=2082293 RepID=A0A2J6PP31_9HELO|nr:hypothetical protein NA56DRAFT_709431 [Hyaloscypha hepaticicola]